MSAVAPLRICHVIHDLRACGAEHVLADLARLAPGGGIEMSVLSLMPLTGRRHPRILSDLGAAASI